MLVLKTVPQPPEFCFNSSKQILIWMNYTVIPKDFHSKLHCVENFLCYSYINHGPPVLMLYNHVKTVRITAERVEIIEVWAALFGAEIINDETKKSHVLATASVGSAAASRPSSLSPCCLRFVSSFVDNNNNIDPRVKLTFVSCF
ncbi:hypothetical protein P3S68_003192 [Capsicum galapagoense]